KTASRTLTPQPRRGRAECPSFDHVPSNAGPCEPGAGRRSCAHDDQSCYDLRVGFGEARNTPTWRPLPGPIFLCPASGWLALASRDRCQAGPSPKLIGEALDFLAWDD